MHQHPRRRRWNRCPSRVSPGGARAEPGLSPAALELRHHAQRLPAPGAGGGGGVVGGAKEARGDAGVAAQRARVRCAGLHDDQPPHEGEGGQPCPPQDLAGGHRPRFSRESAAADPVRRPLGVLAPARQAALPAQPPLGCREEGHRAVRSRRGGVVQAGVKTRGRARLARSC